MFVRFKDALSLSEQLTAQVLSKPDKDSIILSLTKGSLTAALHVGAILHGWVYPFVTIDITDTAQPTRKLGVIAQNGMFASAHFSAEQPEIVAALHEQKATALHNLNTELQKLGVSFDTNILRGRTVVLVADGLIDPTTMLAACQFAHGAESKSIYTLIGNASTTVAEIARSYSEQAVVLDIVNTVDFNDSRQYQFQSLLPFSDQLAFMKNIKTYWI